MTPLTNNSSLNLRDAQEKIAQLQQLLPDIIQPVDADAIHSDKDFRGIYKNPAELLKQFNQGIPLGYYGYGESITNPISEADVRNYRFLLSLTLSELLKGHIRLVGPTRAGKSEFLCKLVVNLAYNYGFSIVWFSTKWEDDKAFFEAIFPEHTVISANEIPLTRLTRGRLTPYLAFPSKMDALTLKIVVN